jgi:phosphoesterase RecJ-like protein
VDYSSGLVYNIFLIPTDETFRLLLAEKMKVFPEHRAAYIWLSREELNRFSHLNGDTEGFV